MFLVVRGADHLLLGVSWSGFRPAGTADGGIPVLVAVDDSARVVLTFPPQHVAEETSAPGTPAPAELPGGPAGGAVPVWRALLAGPSRVAFGIAGGTRLLLSVEGILEALAGSPIGSSRAVPGPGDTAIELPWRLVTVPENGSGGGGVWCVHPTQPVSSEGVTGLWRTRMMAKAAVGDSAASPADAGLNLVPVDGVLAGAPDPGFVIPLGLDDRKRIFSEGSRQPAQASRLELSTLGGTLAAAGVWDNFQWEHLAVLGRDLKVRTLAKGALYPLGHRAEYVVFTERIFDPSAGNAAVLRTVRVLTVTEPVREPPQDDATRRAFPFDEVEITRRSFADLAPAGWQPYPDPGGLPAYFWPATGDLQRVLFPVACQAPLGTVRFAVPLIFVADLLPQFPSLTDPGLAATLANEYGQAAVPLPGTSIDLVRSADHRDGDVHEVHAITIEGGLHTTGYRPRLTGLQVALPALRSLLGDNDPRPVQFAEDFLRNGASEDVVLRLSGPPINVGFAKNADKSGGLVSPAYVADGISRSLGPVNTAALPAPVTGLINPRSLFPDDATILGFPLRDLVTALRVPPEITSLIQAGQSPEVRLHWTSVQLKSEGPFVATGSTLLDLTVDIKPAGSDTTCTVRDFALVLPPGAGQLLQLKFGALTFTHRSGQQPHLGVTGLEATFLGSLELLEELEKAVDLGTAEQFVDVTPAGIAAHYSLPVPPVSAGAFVLRDIILHAGVDVPFDGRPVNVSLSFASRDKPFGLSILMFGGTGYIDLLLDHEGLQRLEAALDFGALVAVDFLVASGEVHALGGVRFTLERDGSVSVTGYLRIGGSVEVLGIVSVSIELTIALTYQSARKAMVGRATLVIEIDLTLWSDSVELDSGEWVLAGGGGEPAKTFALVAGLGVGADEADPGLARWREYRAAFAQLQEGNLT